MRSDVLKNLNFHYDNPGHNGFLLFTFDDVQIPGYKIYSDYFPVIWKAIEVKATGTHKVDIRFNSKFRFATCRTEKGILKQGSTISEQLSFTESASLTHNEKDGYKWAKLAKVNSQDNHFEVRNDALGLESISFCTEIPSSSLMPEALLYIEKFPSGQSMKIGFAGRLRIYHAQEIPKNLECDTTCPKCAILHEAPSTAKIWEHSLDEHDLASDWNVTYDQNAGHFKINPVK